MFQLSAKETVIFIAFLGPNTLLTLTYHSWRYRQMETWFHGSFLSMIDMGAWFAWELPGGKKSFPKDRLVYGPDPNGHRNLLTTISDSEHSQLRNVFSPAFSERSLQAQGPLISKYVDQLIGNMSRHIQANPRTTFDMVKLYNLTIFDIMAELAFGEPLGLLASSSYSEWVGNIFGNLKANAIAQIGREWPWLGNLIQMVTPHYLKKASELHFAHAIERVDRRIETTSEKADIWNLVLSQPDSRQITKGDMYTNSSLFMVAESETTATILSGVTYLLLQTQTSWHVWLQRFDRLAVLNEGLRWYPPVPVGVWREVPEGGSAIAGNWVPAKTRVSVPQYAANHSSRNFKDPDAFVPERWLPGPEFEPNTKDVVQPFSLGPRNCIGMNLAWHEMRYILAKILWHFDLSLCAESASWTKQKTYVLWEKFPLMVSVEPVQ
ncbi:cytochrome p450 monooxygenase [Colletotrichum camelliae]|nr:cytochrome p450 monooxygenase [Colletotrichum camelliae]